MGEQVFAYMRKQAIRNLFRRRLPTRPLNSAAGDGKRHGLRVSCDPFGWDPGCASSVLPNRRSARAGRGEPAATGSEVYIPNPLHTSTWRRVSAMICLNSFIASPQTGRIWGGPQQGNGTWTQKRVRKVPSVPDRLKQQTFRTLKQVPVFFLMAVRRSRSFLRRSAVSSK